MRKWHVTIIAKRIENKTPLLVLDSSFQDESTSGYDDLKNIFQKKEKKRRV
jgi:hypothetical protein